MTSDVMLTHYIFWILLNLLSAHYHIISSGKQPPMKFSCLLLFPSNFSCSPLSDNLTPVLVQLHHKLFFQSSIHTFSPSGPICISHTDISTVLVVISRCRDSLSRYMWNEEGGKGSVDWVKFPAPYLHLKQSIFIFVCFMYGGGHIIFYLKKT